MRWLSSLLLLLPLQLLQAAPLIIADPSAPHQQFKQTLLEQLETTLSDIPPDQLTITIGPQALQQTLNQSSTPLLALLVTQDQFTSATADLSHKASAIYREQPLSRLLRLIEISSPFLQQVGLLVTSPLELPSTPLWVKQQTAPRLRHALNTLLPEVDTLLIYHNPDLFTPTTMRHILLSSYRQQKPLICHTEALVRAGCMVGVHSNPEAWIKTAREWLVAYQQSNYQQLPPSLYSQYFSVSTNRKVARSLGFDLPHPDLLNRQLQQQAPAHE